MAVEITEEFVWQSIPPRARDSHKGTFGSVLAEMCIRDRC